MRYTAVVGDDTIQFDLEPSTSGDVAATIQGRSYRLQPTEVEPGIFWFTQNGRSVEVQVSASSNGYVVLINGHRVNVRLLDRRALLQGAGSRTRNSRNEVRSPMPGKIVRILVREGDRVDKDDDLLIVEAMKMQNRMSASGAGIVEKIMVAEGETVNAGDLLVVVASD
jgi:biotin carboxyl carrier protein